MWRFLLLLGLAMLCESCANRFSSGSFRVVPGQPQYLLRSPDASTTPFNDVLDRYNGFVPGKDWMDLRPRMQLRVENAYYKPGTPKRGLNGYLGTEVAQYRVTKEGTLHLLSFKSMADRPVDQPAVQQLVPHTQERYRFHRFYFEILFKNSAQGSVLIGANSAEEIARLAGELISHPDSTCGAQSTHCTVFPELCSVSAEMEIVVNGASKVVLWGSSLASIATNPRELNLRRFYNGSQRPIEIDPHDAIALRLPLLPGDQIRWK
jgi:hypothetical protein